MLKPGMIDHTFNLSTQQRQACRDCLEKKENKCSCGDGKWEYFIPRVVKYKLILPKKLFSKASHSFHKNKLAGCAGLRQEG